MARFKSASGNQITIDPDRPQTKAAQRLPHYDGPVPSYIEAREGISRRAGLSVRRLRGDRHHGLVSVYSGSKHQIAACALINCPEQLSWPKGTRCPSLAPLTSLTLGVYLASHLFRISDYRFAIMTTEQLPTEFNLLPGGIEHYYFKSKWYEREMFIGGKDQLINGGFAERRMFPDDSTETGRLTNYLDDGLSIDGRYFLALETERLSDGKFALIRHLDEMARARELEKQRDKEACSDMTSPEEWLESKEDFICQVVRAGLLGAAAQVKTKSGFRYSINGAHAQDIIQMIEAAAQRIRDLPVKVEKIAIDEGNETARDRVSAASMDALFQRFIGRVVGTPPNPASGA